MELNGGLKKDETHPSVFQVYLCGNSANAKQAVSEMATKLGLTVLDRGSLSAARELEDFPLRLFPEWRLPLLVAACLMAFFYFYLLIRDVIYAYVEKGQDISYRIMISLANKVETCPALPVCCRLPLESLLILFVPQVFPIVSLVMLSLCYLPGCIAAVLQLYRGTKYKSVPLQSRP